MTPPEEANFRKSFRELLDVLATFKPTPSLLRVDKEVNFVQAEPLFRRISDFIELLKSVTWDKVPGAYIQSLLSPLQSLNAKLDAVKTFSAMHGEPTRNRDMTVNQVEAQFNQTYNEVVPHLSFELITGASNVVDRLRSDWNAVFRTSLREAEEGRNAILKGKEQLDFVIKEMQD